MVIASRRIVLINVTTSPGLAWVQQQLRQATAWCETPRFLIHDNDGIFGQFRDRKRRGKKGRRYRCRLDLWLADVMGIEGIPIPYGAPNANPHIERFNRTLREEALNHFIFLNVKHVLSVCRDFARFYNRARPSQALHAVPDPYPELKKALPKNGKLIVHGVDTLTGGQALEIPADLVVLAVPSAPNESEELSATLRIASDSDGFFQELHPKLRPVETLTAGVYLAGSAQGPKDIPEAVCQASAAASKGMELLSQPVLQRDPTTAEIDDTHCVGCLRMNSSTAFEHFLTSSRMVRGFPTTQMGSLIST